MTQDTVLLKTTLSQLFGRCMCAVFTYVEGAYLCERACGGQGWWCQVSPIVSFCFLYWGKASYLNLEITDSARLTRQFGPRIPFLYILRPGTTGGLPYPPSIYTDAGAPNSSPQISWQVFYLNFLPHSQSFFFFNWDRASYSTDWPLIYYVAKAGLEYQFFSAAK